MSFNILESLPGNGSSNMPWENDKKLSRRKNPGGKADILAYDIGCIFSLSTPRWFQEDFQKKDSMDSRRIHTRGNPSSEILYGVENPERLIRRRPGKEIINTSQTEGSFS